MAELKIERRSLRASAETVFLFLSDMTNYKELMPENIENWQATETTCKFGIKGLATLDLVMDEKKPYSSIRVKSGEKSPFSFEFTVFLENEGEGSVCWIEFTGDINPFMWMMAEKPLGAFLGSIAKKLQARYS